MPKKPKRKNLKPPGKCVFCGGGAVPGNPMSGEHLWSDWMDKANLLKRISREYIEAGLNFRRFAADEKEFFRHREGSPHYRKIKVVCQICNNGWMSAIETEVQPILTPLIKGQKVKLTRNARTKLAEWICLKILVAEHNQYADHGPTSIYSQSDRDAFRLGRKIPEGLRIYLGKHKSLEWQTGYHRHSAGLGLSPPILPPTRSPPGERNVQSITWGIGRLLVYASGITDAEIAWGVRFVKDPALKRLWPLLSNDVAWPPAKIVDGDYIDDLATSLGRYLDRTASQQ